MLSGIQRNWRSTVLVARASYATRDDISIEYAKKQYDLQFKDTDELKKRFLNGLHPDVVQSKAFDRASISSLRMNLATHHEGQPPALTELINRANANDQALENAITAANEEDPLYNMTRHFEYGLYRRGDEDSAINMKIDWNFYRQAFPDTEFIDTLQNNYEEMIKDAFEECQTEDPVPEESRMFSRFFDQLNEQMEARFEPYFDTADDLEYDAKNIPSAIEEVIHDWDEVKLWVAAPNVAAEIQNRIDNNMWDMSDESEWIVPEKAPQ